MRKTFAKQLWISEQHLRSSAHNLRITENHPARIALEFEISEKRPREAPMKRRKDINKQEVGATIDDVLDRTKWRQITRAAHLRTEWQTPRRRRDNMKWSLTEH